MHLVLEKLAKKKEPNLNERHKKNAYMRVESKQQLKSPLTWVLDIAKECWVTSSFIMKTTSSGCSAKFWKVILFLLFNKFHQWSITSSSVKLPLALVKFSSRHCHHVQIEPLQRCCSEDQGDFSIGPMCSKVVLHMDSPFFWLLVKSEKLYYNPKTYLSTGTPFQKVSFWGRPKSFFF